MSDTHSKPRVLLSILKHSHFDDNIEALSTAITAGFGRFECEKLLKPSGVELLNLPPSSHIEINVLRKSLGAGTHRDPLYQTAVPISIVMQGALDPSVPPREAQVWEGWLGLAPAGSSKGHSIEYMFRQAAELGTSSARVPRLYIRLQYLPPGVVTSRRESGSGNSAARADWNSGVFSLNGQPISKGGPALNGPEKQQQQQQQQQREHQPQKQAQQPALQQPQPTKPQPPARHYGFSTPIVGGAPTPNPMMSTPLAPTPKPGGAAGESPRAAMFSQNTASPHNRTASPVGAVPALAVAGISDSRIGSKVSNAVESPTNSHRSSRPSSVSRAVVVSQGTGSSYQRNVSKDRNTPFARNVIPAYRGQSPQRPLEAVARAGSATPAEQRLGSHQPSAERAAPSWPVAGPIEQQQQQHEVQSASPSVQPLLVRRTRSEEFQGWSSAPNQRPALSGGRSSMGAPPRAPTPNVVDRLDPQLNELGLVEPVGASVQSTAATDGVDWRFKCEELSLQLAQTEAALGHQRLEFKALLEHKDETLAQQQLELNDALARLDSSPLCDDQPLQDNAALRSRREELERAEYRGQLMGQAQLEREVAHLREQAAQRDELSRENAELRAQLSIASTSSDAISKEVDNFFDRVLPVLQQLGHDFDAKSDADQPSTKFATIVSALNEAGAAAASATAATKIRMQKLATNSETALNQALLSEGEAAFDAWLHQDAQGTDIRKQLDGIATGVLNCCRRVAAVASATKVAAAIEDAERCMGVAYKPDKADPVDCLLAAQFLRLGVDGARMAGGFVRVSPGVYRVNGRQRVACRLDSEGRVVIKRPYRGGFATEGAASDVSVPMEQGRDVQVGFRDLASALVPARRSLGGGIDAGAENEDDSHKYENEDYEAEELELSHFFEECKLALTASSLDDTIVPRPAMHFLNACTQSAVI